MTFANRLAMHHIATLQLLELLSVSLARFEDGRQTGRLRAFPFAVFSILMKNDTIVNRTMPFTFVSGALDVGRYGLANLSRPKPRRSKSSKQERYGCPSSSS